MPCRTLLGLYTLLGAGGKSVESRQAVATGRSGSGGTRGSAGPGATPSLRRVPSPSLAARWRKSLRRTCSRFSLAPSVSPGTWCAPGCLRAQRLVNFYRLYAACFPRLERVGLLGSQALLGPDGRPWVGRSLGAAGFWSLGGWLPGPRTESFPLPASGPAGRTGLFRCWGQGRESCAHPKPARQPGRPLGAPRRRGPGPLRWEWQEGCPASAHPSGVKGRWAETWPARRSWLGPSSRGLVFRRD